MTPEERLTIMSEEYADLLIDYFGNRALLERFSATAIQIMNERYAIARVPVAQITGRSVGLYGYSTIPALFGISSQVSIAASGVNRLRNIPNFNLRGQGVLIGVIDTGIDYNNPVFLRADGTTKIVSIWDQTIDSVDAFPADTFYGTEYTQEQINLALMQPNPLEVVPSTDFNGHGTMLAGVAAGSEIGEFSGVATDSELVVVKLKQAKQHLRNFFVIPDGVDCFQSNDIMFGVQYCIQKARQLQRPIVLCLGVGTSMDAHDGRSPLSTFLSIVADFPGVIVVTSVGNEGNLGRHYYGVIDPTIGYNTVELQVGENEIGFSMELWGDAPGVYSIDILSPTGEYIPRIAESIQVNREISFIFERTVIYIDYQMVEALTGDQLILMRFRDPTPGTWRFNVYGRGDLPAGFHIWLPMGDFLSTTTFFTEPDIYTTVLAPSTSVTPIAITAYDPVTNSLFRNASRGYSRSLTIKPELAAPGVNYYAPTINNQFANFNGTSVAAAHTAGIAALIMEWAVIRGNFQAMSSLELKKFLIRGARRSPNITYPNRDWGYGYLDIFNMFDVLRADMAGV